MESNAMESPLIVLSRAASMVETSSRGIGESVYPLKTSTEESRSPIGSHHGGAGVDLRASPGRELPSRAARQDRLQLRQQWPLVGSQLPDNDHEENHVKISISTQTQFSSFGCENLPPPPYYSMHETISQERPGLPLPPPPHHYYSHDSTQLNSSPHHPPPPHASQSQAAPAPHTSTSQIFTSLSSSSSTSISSSSVVPHTAMSVYDIPPPPPPPPHLPPYPSSHRSSPPRYTEMCQPLNLSLSRSSSPSSVVPPSHTSAISCLSIPMSSKIQNSPESAINQENYRNKQTQREEDLNPETAAQMSDEAIEEHFRRSLGTCYTELSPAKSSFNVDAPDKKCSVDDHFARALGDKMWTELKKKSEYPSMDTRPGSVDAHFAKALGASTWQKLKAETKVIDLVPAQKQSQQQPIVRTSPPPASSHHRPLAT